MFSFRNLVQLITIISVAHLEYLHCDDPNANDELGKTTAQLIELRQFRSKTHLVIVNGSYVLNLVRATNPLINNGSRGASGKLPVLFVHGFMNNANNWLVNSVNIRPKDWSSMDINSMSDQQLNQMALNETSFKSVVFTLLNFGYECWLLNRRGTIESQGYVDSLSSNTSSSSSSSTAQSYNGTPMYATQFDSRYWNFSYDSQAAYDVQQVANYIIEQTNQTQLIYIGQSAGGALALMSLIVNPKFSDKLNKVLLYAPALYLEGSSSSANLYQLPVLVNGSFPCPSNSEVLLERTQMAALCQTQQARSTVCSAMLNAMYGPDGGAENFLPGYPQGNVDVASSMEAAQLLQTVVKGKMHFYDYMNDAQNQIAYNQPTPPIYDVSKITSMAINIFYGNTDTLVPSADVQLLLSDFRVPVQSRFINLPNISWNHESYFFHDNIPTVVTVPTLRYLAS